MITFHEPYQRGDGWHMNVEGLNHRAINTLYAHEVVRGSFVFPNPATGKAFVGMDSLLVKRYGVWRCWWLVREDILDTGEQFRPLAAVWETAMAVALIPDELPPAETNEADDLPSIGNLGWQGDNDGMSGYDDDCYYGSIGWRG